MPEVLHAFARGAQRDLGAVRDRGVLLDYHCTYPGLGHVERHAGGSRFVPAG